MPKLRNSTTVSFASAASLTSVALSQTPGGAGPILINGTAVVATASVPGSSAPQQAPGGPLSSSQILVPSAGFPVTGSAAIINPVQKLVLSSAGNDVSMTWTINGLDRNGQPISESLAGSGAGFSVTSANEYSQVNSILTSRAPAGAITVGTETAENFSAWLIAGAQRNNYTTTVRTFIGAGQTATYDVQATSDPNVMINPGGQVDDIVTLTTAANTSGSINEVTPYYAYRVRMTAGGPVTLRLIESRTA